MSQAPVLLSAEQFSQLATKDYIDKKIDILEEKLDLRFNQLDYKIETCFDNLHVRLDREELRREKQDKHINELNLFTADHAMRIKRLEFRVF
jgi:hypothetical protein